MLEDAFLEVGLPGGCKDKLVNMRIDGKWRRTSGGVLEYGTLKLCHTPFQDV